MTLSRGCPRTSRLRALTSLKIHSGSDEWFVLSKGLLQGLSQLRSLHLRGVELQADSDQDDDDDDDNNNDDDVAFSSQDAVEMWQHLEVRFSRQRRKQHLLRRGCARVRLISLATTEPRWLKESIHRPACALQDLHITQVLPEESVIRALPRLPGLTSLYLHYGMCSR